MPRTTCPNCTYPKNTCVCSSIEHFALPCRCVILQHPKESKHAKNTVKLAKLVAPEIEVILEDDVLALKQLRASLSDYSNYLIYPSAQSQGLETNIKKIIETNTFKKNNTQKDNSKALCFIFLDGTWKQVYGMLQRQSWLNNLVHLHFDALPEKHYTFRKSRKDFQLSTIEALAHTFKTLELHKDGLEQKQNLEAEKFLKAFECMGTFWLQNTSTSTVAKNA